MISRLKVLFTSTIAVAVLSVSLTAAQDQPTSPPARGYPTATGGANTATRSLKDAYAGHFLIGTAGDIPGNYSDAELELIKQTFNVVTPENCMKPQSVHPAEDRWTFGAADALVKFCTDNHIQVVGHCLVWHAQTGNWFFRAPEGQQMTKELLLARLKTHIQTEVGRYKGKIKGWDVVNEAINDGGRAGGENLRATNWQRIIGDDYLVHAFKYAHEADPGAELQYNDYNIEAGTKHASSLLLLKRLIAAGAPITGVGIQGHWSLQSVPYAAVDKAIDDYKALGLKVMITELDTTASGAGGGQFGYGGGRGGAADPKVSIRQAEAYKRLFQIFEKHKDAVTRVTFWGLNDRRTWRRGQNPLIFDANNQRKPAYQSILDAVLEPH